MAHQGMVVGRDPRLVVALHELAEVGIGVALLHEQHLLHGVVGLGELQLPAHKLAVDVHPLGY